MRFFLDHNVDAAVARRLKRMGHEAWAAEDVGLSVDSDDTLTVYAIDRSCVLLTHDKEFSERRRRNVIGHHVFLRCDELVAADLLAAHLAEILPVIEHHQDLFVCVYGEGVDYSHRWA